MLSHANEQDGYIGRVDEADERADHVAYCVALGNDEAVQGSD